MINLEEIVREYIDKTVHMSLGTSSDGKPWVCEVHFVYDENLNLYFRSLKSRRHSLEIAVNPNVAGNIVKQHSVEEYPHAIYFEGEAKLVDNANERSALFPLFQKRLHATEAILKDAAQEDGHHFYKITVKNWYAFGKFGESSSAKHELDWNGGQPIGQNQY